MEQHAIAIDKNNKLYLDRSSLNMIERIITVEHEIKVLHEDNNKIWGEIKELRKETKEIRKEIKELREDTNQQFKELREDANNKFIAVQNQFVEVQKQFIEVQKQFVEVQKQNNKNTTLLLVAMGVCTTIASLIIKLL